MHCGEHFFILLLKNNSRVGRLDVTVGNENKSPSSQVEMLDHCCRRKTYRVFPSQLTVCADTGPPCLIWVVSFKDTFYVYIYTNECLQSVNCFVIPGRSKNSASFLWIFPPLTWLSRWPLLIWEATVLSWSRRSSWKGKKLFYLLNGGQVTVSQWFSGPPQMTTPMTTTSSNDIWSLLKCPSAAFLLDTSSTALYKKQHVFTKPGPDDKGGQYWCYLNFLVDFHICLVAAWSWQVDAKHFTETCST